MSRFTQKVFYITPLVCSMMLAAAFFGGCAARSERSRAAASSAEWVWEKPITLICPWGIGGGADGTLRALAPILQRVTGVSVKVVNVDGGGGINGVAYAREQPDDGYTYTLGTQSVIMLDVRKLLPFDFREEFTPVALLAHSTNILIGSSKTMEGKFSDFAGFISYIQQHPRALTCGMISATGADMLSLQETLSGALGIKASDVERYVKTASFSGGMELNSALSQGYADISIAGAGEIKNLLKSGAITPLIILAEQRIAALPDTPCAGELGIHAYTGTWRALFARTSVPRAARDSLTAALEQAWNSPEYQSFLKEAELLDRSVFSGASAARELEEREYENIAAYLAYVYG